MTLQPETQAALDKAEASLALIRSADGCVVQARRIIDQFPECAGWIHVQESGTIGVVFWPVSVDQLTLIVRKFREISSSYKVQEDGEGGKIHYWMGRFYLCAELSKECTFEKVGTNLVEAPVYKIVCK